MLHKDFSEDIGEEDSTRYGWGFEIAAMRSDTEMATEMDECVAAITMLVTEFAADKMGEGGEDLVVPDPCFVYPVVDCIVNLFDDYKPIMGRMMDLRTDRVHLLTRCASPPPWVPEQPPVDVDDLPDGLWDLDHMDD
jgi:hypothetical protein